MRRPKNILEEIHWYANKLSWEAKLNGRCQFFLDEIVSICEEQVKARLVGKNVIVDGQEYTPYDAEQLLLKRKG